MFFYIVCSIYRPLLLNVNLLCNAFFPSCLKRVYKIKGKQKEKGIKKIISSSIKNPNLANLFSGVTVKNITPFGFVQYLSTTELEIFVDKCSLTLDSGTL